MGSCFSAAAVDPGPAPPSTKSADGRAILVAPETVVSPAEQAVLDILLRRFAGRASVSPYMCVQLMRSPDLKGHGRGDPARVGQWAQHAGDLVDRIATWREENAIDGLADRALAKGDRFAQMWPEGVNGADRHGRPVHWQRIAQIPPEAMLSEFTPDEVITLHVQGTERCRRACLAKCRRDGHVFIGQCEVLDLTGFGMQHFSPKFFKLIRAVIDVDLAMYDSMMCMIVVVNTPWLFAQMWRLIKPLLDEETKQKIFLCDEHASAAKLRELGIAPSDRIAGFVLRE